VGEEIKIDTSYVSHCTASNWNSHNVCDAIVHISWTATMAFLMGESASRQWASAHEYGESGSNHIRDVRNNELGFSVAGQHEAYRRAHGGSFESFLRYEVGLLVHYGGYWLFSKRTGRVWRA
jgi:hypothetical protein